METIDVAAGKFHDLSDYLERLGIAVEPVLAEAGLTALQLQRLKADQGLSARDYSRFYRAAVKQLQRIRDVSNLEKRLDARHKRSPEQFTQVMKARESLHHVDGEYRPPAESLELLGPGTYHLVLKDAHGRRSYNQTTI